MHVCPQHELTNVATEAKLKLKATQRGDRENKNRTPTGLVRNPAVSGLRDALSGGGSGLAVVVMQHRMRPCLVRSPAVSGLRDTLSGGSSGLAVVVMQHRMRPCFSSLQP